jgi:toxin YoeB
MKITFTDSGWNGFMSWQADKRSMKQIEKLLNDIRRNGHNGLGKPERLSGNWSGWWSRRINEKDRLIYRIDGETIEIAQCGRHYDDH